MGLRYVDVIDRKKLCLEQVSWNELIEPHVLGVMTPDVETGIRSYRADAEYQNSENNASTKVHFELVHVNNQKELSLLIDCDYFTQEITQTNGVNIVADMLHLNSSNFISSAITERLSEAMEPVEIK